MINRDFVNIKVKDRFHQDYELTSTEKKFALLSSLILVIECLFGLFYWMLHIAMR